jgi:hypothetical protein
LLLLSLTKHCCYCWTKAEKEKRKKRPDLENFTAFLREAAGAEGGICPMLEKNLM